MQIINLIVPLFIVMFVGYAMKRTGFLPEKFGNQLNRFVYYIALPVMLFVSTSSSDIRGIDSFKIIISFMITVAVVLLISFIASSGLKNIRGPFIQASFRCNMAYLGIPIVTTTFGEDALGIAAIIVMVAVITNTILSILILKAFGKDHKPPKLRELFVNPLVISIVAGLIFSYFALPLPIIISNTFDFLARVSLPLILIVIGYSLSFNEIKKYIMPDFIAATIKLIIMPAVAFIVLNFLGLHGLELKTAVLLTAMPTAVMSQAFAKELKADSHFAASAVNFSTLSSIITISILVMLLNGM
ncbi:AEC family transporter [Candidatus Woesearchaeota archaeon]|nr:AEC family transporter [Candidatus Woesearchaeota archaeon]